MINKIICNITARQRPSISMSSRGSRLKGAFLEARTGQRKRFSCRSPEFSEETVAKGRTTLIVAHRPSTIRSADRVVVLNAGRVAESGQSKSWREMTACSRTLSQPGHRSPDNACGPTPGPVTASDHEHPLTVTSDIYNNTNT
jgi:hypothetical protein